MITSNILEEVLFNEKRPAIKVLFETESSKEIRILLKSGQVMAEHKTSYPITVAIVDGTLDFGVEGQVHSLVQGVMLVSPNMSTSINR